MFGNWSVAISQHKFGCKSFSHSTEPLKTRKMVVFESSIQSFPIIFQLIMPEFKEHIPSIILSYSVSQQLTFSVIKFPHSFHLHSKNCKNLPKILKTSLQSRPNNNPSESICTVFSSLFRAQTHKKHCQRIQWEFSTYIMLFAASYNFKLNKSVPQLMCFLKFITSVHTAPVPSKEQTPFFPLEDHRMAAFPSPFLQLSKNMGGFGASDLNLLNCLKMMSFNSQLIQNLQASLTANSELLEKSQELVPLKKIQETDSANCDQLSESDQTVEGLQHSSDHLTTKLFGCHGYKYKLVLADQLADTLYKDRNFKINVKLVNLLTGEVQNNGNLINICLSICDSNGEWIHEAKEGGAFLKGKLQADLYHGCGQFVKLSPRDVSRSFTDKKVNIVVYAKPSMLKYSGESSIQRVVDFKLVEPLVIKDVSIKAKKRQ